MILPAARSGEIAAPDKIMRAIFDAWDDEAKWLRASLRHMRPMPPEEDIDDAIIATAEKMIEKPPKFQSLLHARRWMRMVARNCIKDGWRFGKKFRELEDVAKVEVIDDWRVDFEDEDLKQAALEMLDEESAELLRMHISGLSITEIAEVKGMHRTTLQKRLKRIHALLKENLK